MEQKIQDCSAQKQTNEQIPLRKKEIGLNLKYNQKYEEAAKMFQTLILQNLEKEKVNFIGLGCKQQQAGYLYQSDEEYLRSNLPLNPSSFDCLSFCISSCNFQGATIWYKQLRNKYPDCAEIYQGLGNLFYNKDCYEEARVCYLKAVQLGLNCQRTFSNLAYIFYYRYLDPQSAQKNAENIEKSKLKECLLPYSEHILILIKYQNEQQLQELQELKLKYPKYIRVINSLGQNGYEIHQNIQLFEICIEQDPTYTVPYYNLGIAYFENGKYEKSLDIFKKCLQIDPNHYESEVWMGKLNYVQTGDFESSVERLKKGLKSKRSRHLTCFETGVIYLMRGQQIKAIPWFKKCIQYNTRYYQAYSALAMIQQRSKNYTNAITLHQKSIQLNPTKSNDYSLNAVAQDYFHLSMYDQAIAKYEFCINKIGWKKLSSSSYCRLIFLYSYKKQIEKAIICGKNAIKIYPQKAYLKIYLGRVYVDFKMWSEAYVTLQQCWKYKCERRQLLANQDEEAAGTEAYLQEYYGCGKNWTTKKQLGRGSLRQKAQIQHFRNQFLKMIQMTFQY